VAQGFSGSGLQWGRVPANAVHLCIDMQRLFAEETDWKTPWMARVLPVILNLCEHKADRTCFTRFIPATNAAGTEGSWRRYWEAWPTMTLEALGADMIDLIPDLARYVPPGPDAGQDDLFALAEQRA
jgi:nicotinamidase-related amidase